MATKKNKISKSDQGKSGREKTAVIIGAGPAGLTAAVELLARTAYRPVVLEATEAIGGIAQTVNYKGNRMDLGGHRFFSKSDRAMSFWLRRMPLETGADGQSGPDPEEEDRVMLLRSRLSRIYFLRRFFDYPISLNVRTVLNLGLARMMRIGLSYGRALCFPVRQPKNLEEFFINRFGRELYQTFFKSYTEKVWGVPCQELSAEWGAQRIKGLSILKALEHRARELVSSRRRDIAQKDVETSLIEQFIYPKYGPGQMWQMVADEIQGQGGTIKHHRVVDQIKTDGQRITAVGALNRLTGKRETFAGDLFFSTMAVQDLLRAFQTDVPPNVRDISEGLRYRDFITVGLLLRRMKVTDEGDRGRRLIRDNWVYIQEPDVQLGRLQIFNNWSPYLVADPDTVWLGLEYFCDQGDALWSRSDEELIELGTRELAHIGLIEASEVLDATALRVPKTYPAYMGTYDRFDELRAYVDAIENLFLIGRNGMHRYNNQDHSMLAAMTAVDNIVAGRRDRSNIWEVNAEQEYHEEKG